MMGGYDKETDQTHLYYIDYLAAGVPIDYYAFGIGGLFTISILDTEYKPGNLQLELN